LVIIVTVSARVYHTRPGYDNIFFFCYEIRKWGDNGAANCAVAVGEGQTYYNRLMSEVKPFRLTESVKAAG
jgi:hypothetical protein